MKTPKEKYMNDNIYHAVVDNIEGMIHKTQYTPEEIREACILASIHFEINQLKYHTEIEINEEVEKALKILQEFTSK